MGFLWFQMSMGAIPSRFATPLTASAPASIAALATSAMRPPSGVSFAMIGMLSALRSLRTTSATASSSWPMLAPEEGRRSLVRLSETSTLKDMLGQQKFSSRIWAPAASNRRAPSSQLSTLAPLSE